MLGRSNLISTTTVDAASIILQVSVAIIATSWGCRDGSTLLKFKFYDNGSLVTSSKLCSVLEAQWRERFYNLLDGSLQHAQIGRLEISVAAQHAG